MISVSLAFNNPQSARTHPHDIKNEFCLHHVLDAKIVMTAMRCAQSASEKLEIWKFLLQQSKTKCVLAAGTSGRVTQGVGSLFLDAKIRLAYDNGETSFQIKFKQEWKKINEQFILLSLMLV
jgi:hypothetical protein